MWAVATHAENWLSTGGLRRERAACVGDKQGGAHSRHALTQLSPGHHGHLQTEDLSLSKTLGWTRNASELD